MRTTAPLLLVALLGCAREAGPGHPILFSDPARVDLAVDAPDEALRGADVVIANLGDAPTRLSEVAVVGERADLVRVDVPADAELPPGGVVTLRVTAVASVITADALFREELELVAVGEAAEGDAPRASTIVGVGTLLACDGDADGALGAQCGGDDCADDASAVFPGAVESCNAIDDDCDGTIDGADAEGAEIRFTDADADGFGDEATATLLCFPGPGDGVAIAGDCDDLRDDVFPDADETCDGADQDCDGTADEDALDAVRFYGDRDGDGFGGAATTTFACEAPVGFAATPDDCRDDDATAFPGAVETCDGVDDDCDGAVDDSPVDPLALFVDQDRDGHGDTARPTTACSAAPGLAVDGDDCDDTLAAVSPGAVEACNGRDDDCDGLVDEGTVASFYRDADGDKYGDPDAPSAKCQALPGYVSDARDCDDADKTVSPGATETCDGVDDDCNGLVDDNASDGVLYYADADADSYGNPGVSRRACAVPSGYVGDRKDCNDADGDGFGDPAVTTTSCPQPAGYVATATDCQDANARVYPGAAEQCNAQDDDCDGQGDEGNVCPCPTFTRGTTFYLVCDVALPAVGALAACQAFGYDAVAIETPEEDAFLDAACDVVDSNGTFYIGLNDVDREGAHEWYTGEPVTYLDWAPGQPSDANGLEDCVVIDAQGRWGDVRCSSSHGFVCEAR